jgi:hypothetical protein
VKAAPRRAWAFSGFGRAESCARVRWKPSRGRKAAIVAWCRAGEDCWCRELRAETSFVARVVLPVNGMVSEFWVLIVRSFHLIGFGRIEDFGYSSSVS